MSDSELKKLKPVTAYAMILCEHANCRVLFKRFKELVESEEGKGDDKLVEMMVRRPVLWSVIRLGTASGP